MRNITFISLLILNIGCNSTKNITAKSSKLNGTWAPVLEEVGGKILPAGSFKNQRLILSDNAYTMIAESGDKGTVRYNGNKMDIYGKEGPNAGKHYTAIYKFENGQLTICYNLSGNEYPEAFDTKGKPLYFLSIFKKE